MRGGLTMATTIAMVQDKVTLHSIRFKEVLETPFDAPKIGSLYVDKHALREIGWTDSPECTLVVTLECVK